MTRDVVTRSSLGYGLECGVLDLCVADDQEAYQGKESVSGFRNGIPLKEAYSLPMKAKSPVGSVIASICGRNYTLHLSMMDVSSQRVIMDKAFSGPKCVRLAKLSHHSHRLPKKIWSAVAGPRMDDLSDIWGEALLRLEREITSDFETQTRSGKVPKDAPAVDKTDSVHDYTIA